MADKKKLTPEQELAKIDSQILAYKEKIKALQTKAESIELKILRAENAKLKTEAAAKKSSK